MELGLSVRSSSEPDPRSGALLEEEPVFPCGNALKMEQRMVVVEFRWVGEFVCLR